MNDTGPSVMQWLARVPKRAVRLVVKTFLTIYLFCVNRFSRRSCQGELPVVVCLTSYGRRAESVYLTIESIVRDRARPTRIVLWLDEEPFLSSLPKSLRRLQARGLEIKACENFGPHKKYFPYVCSQESFALPLVTADDDIIYPRGWLEELTIAYTATPDTIISNRARVICMSDPASDFPAIAPYSMWDLAQGTAASFANFSTGTSGVVYPPSMQRALRDLGQSFVDDFWSADDIWLHATAVSRGVRTRQAGDRARLFPMRLRSQSEALFRRNHSEGGNDAMICAAYTPEMIKRIQSDLQRSGPNE